EEGGARGQASECVPGENRARAQEYARRVRRNRARVDHGCCARLRESEKVRRAHVAGAAHAKDALRTRALRERAEEQLADGSRQRERLPALRHTIIEQVQLGHAYSPFASRSGSCDSSRFRSGVRSRGATNVTPPLRTITRSLTP